jgi:hypothetical protein
LATLGDYGYLAKTGYFVWNREQHRYRIGRKPRANGAALDQLQDHRAEISQSGFFKFTYSGRQLS